MRLLAPLVARCSPGTLAARFLGGRPELDDVVATLAAHLAPAAADEVADDDRGRPRRARAVPGAPGDPAVSVLARRLVPALAALLVLLAPVAGDELGRLAARAKDPHAHRTVATVLAHGPLTYPDENALVPDDGVVRAQWTDGQGRTHVGDLYLPDRPDVGATRSTWIDRHGAPTPAPLDEGAVALAVTVVLAGVGVAGVVVVGVATRRPRSTPSGSPEALDVTVSEGYG